MLSNKPHSNIIIEHRFELRVDPTLQCFVDYATAQQQTCEDYIKYSCTPDSTSLVDVTYKAILENVGGACKLVKKVRSLMDGEKYLLDISSLTEAERNLCPGDTISVTQEFPDFNLCAIGGTKTEAEIKLNQGGVGETGMASIQLPVAIETPSPPSTCPTSNTKTRFEFRIVSKSCSSGRYHRSIGLRSRRLRHNGKGNGSKKYNNNQPCDQCDTCIDYDTIHPSRSVSTKIYSLNDPSMVLYDGIHSVGTNIEFVESCMPDCLVIEISCNSGGDDTMLQKVSFDTTKCSVGNMYGAIEIVDYA